MVSVPSDIRIAVVGLGYVGLPLMVGFSHHYPTLGFDIKPERISELQASHDKTRALGEEELTSVAGTFSCNPEDLRACNVYIVTVPTPIDARKRPDLIALKQASELLAHYLCAGDIVIYESTVYPGATEEVCVPILEAGSGLRLNQDFGLGYSPERINPGDRKHRLQDIVKVTAGSSAEVAGFVDQLYARVIDAGTHPVSSIRVAEAAKVIENTQRDLNIALVNELCIIFEKLGLDTEEVLAAAGSKWNFLPFRPGLVGGHCISVDPYYLTHKAEELGYHPDVILAGRRINDEMGAYVAERMIRHMTREKINVVDARVLVLGLSFKENCPDLRNTRVIDVIRNLQDYHVQVDVCDPWVDAGEAHEEYGLELLDTPPAGVYQGIVLAVAHDCFREQGIASIREYAAPKSVIFDVKYLFAAGEGLYRL